MPHLRGKGFAKKGKRLSPPKYHRRCPACCARISYHTSAPLLIPQHPSLHLMISHHAHSFLIIPVSYNTSLYICILYQRLFHFIMQYETLSLYIIPTVVVRCHTSAYLAIPHYASSIVHISSCNSSSCLYKFEVLPPHLGAYVIMHHHPPPSCLALIIHSTWFIPGQT